MTDLALPQVLDSPFFLQSLIFKDGRLSVYVGDGFETATDAVITFDHVRTFLVFREGDFFRDLASYQHIQLIRGKEPSVGVFRIVKNPLLEHVLRGRLESENPGYFWVSTADECVEVVSFSEPVLTKAGGT
jgi:hypothetical protein